MDFTICIVSGNREKSKNFNTPKMLDNLGIKDYLIFLFDETAKKEYVKNHNLDEDKIILTNKKELVNKRNFIEKQFFNDGEKLLCLDDDLTYIKYKNSLGEIVKMTNKDEFIDNFNSAFNLLIKENCRLFGCYPVGGNDKWFSEAKTQIGNNHIIVALSGIIVDKTLEKQDPKYTPKEEYQRAFIYGKNIRLGNITFKTKGWYKNDGLGIRTYETQLETCKEIMKNYPNRYSKTPLKFNKKKTNCDLRLNKTYYNSIC